MDVSAFLDSRADEVSRTFKARVNGIPAVHPGLAKAMLYSLAAGGKRLRPVLAGAVYELFGGRRAEILPAARALEMVHTYSLIHDDLPALDNDDLRRGRPTSHKAFGEAMAILAGDALLTNAFSELAAAGAVKRIGPARALRACSILASRAGAGGMVGGQAADLEAEGFLKGRLSPGARLRRGRARLTYIHQHKTADLLQAAVEIGAVLGGADARQLRLLSAYAFHLGIGFQITDDILDVVGDKKKLGKSGSDARNGKLTYASLYGIERSRAEARRHIEAARRSLGALKGVKKERLGPLLALADFILGRDK